MVVVAVNLYQFASTWTMITGLMDFRLTLFAGEPESGFYHEASDGFFVEHQTVNFLEFLPC